MMRPFGPKHENHPSVGKPCHACDQPFKAGDYTTLITLGPGADPDEQRRARLGLVGNSMAIEVHYSCATGFHISTVTKKPHDAACPDPTELAGPHQACPCPHCMDTGFLGASEDDHECDCAAAHQPLAVKQAEIFRLSCIGHLHDGRFLAHHHA